MARMFVTVGEMNFEDFGIQVSNKIGEARKQAVEIAKQNGTKMAIIWERQPGASVIEDGNGNKYWGMSCNVAEVFEENGTWFYRNGSVKKREIA